MELGFHLPIFDIDGGTPAIAGELARVGAAAEEAGATWLSFMDHYFQIEPTGLPAESNMLEGYTTLGFLAAHTSRIELGLLVTGVTYRHPGLLAKIVTTLDVLSGGPPRHSRNHGKAARLVIRGAVGCDLLPPALLSPPSPAPLLPHTHPASPPYPP